MPWLFVFFWATGFIGGKLGLPHADPFTFLLVRFLIVATLLVLFSLATRAPWPTDWRGVAHIAVAGLFVHATYLGGVFSALKLGTPAGVAALIAGLQPLLVACVVGPVLGERITARQWIGFLLGFAGVVLVVMRTVDFEGAELAGVVFSVISLLGISAGTVYQKRFCSNMDLRTGSVIQFTAAAAATAILAVAFETMHIDWTGEFIFAMAWLIVVLSFGAITLLMVLIRRGAAAKVSSLFYLVPPVTAVLAFLIFGETLGMLAVVGFAVAVLGVALVTREKAA